MCVCVCSNPRSIPLATEVSLDADTSRSGAVSRTLLDKV